MRSELSRVVDSSGSNFPPSDPNLESSQSSEPPGFTRNTAQILRLVKFEHSVFALPLVMAGAFLAAGGIPAISLLVWTIIAAVGARNFSFALNRLADKDFDEKNPRTQDRIAYRHILEGTEIWLFMGISLAVFILSASMLNKLSLLLSPVVVMAIVLYSYAKRWTWNCHWLLGAVYACATAGAWIAVRGDLTAIPLWLALGSAAWVVGFDLIYACLDYDFDLSEGVHSIPARFGISSALYLSAILHIVTIFSFFIVGWEGNLGKIYWIGWLVSTGILIWEHVMVRPSDLSRVNFSFFNLNAWFSVVIGLGVVADVFWRSHIP